MEETTAETRKEDRGTECDVGAAVPINRRRTALEVSSRKVGRRVIGCVEWVETREDECSGGRGE